jgi:hypothetical protein
MRLCRPASRSDGRASFGFALLQGKRPQQEDAAAAQWSRMPGAAPGSEQPIGLFGARGLCCPRPDRHQRRLPVRPAARPPPACHPAPPLADARPSSPAPGVFDGHGGPDAAQYVRSNLFTNLLRNERFAADPKAAISKPKAAISKAKRLLPPSGGEAA